MVHETEKTNSGIYVDCNGNRVIGGSVRDDGSTRKVVKVREGYTPSEDVERYNVKEIREQRRQDTQDEPKQRPKSRFAGLNGLLKANNEVNGRLQRTNGSKLSDSKANKPQNVKEKDNSEIEIEGEDISNLNLNKGSPQRSSEDAANSFSKTPQNRDEDSDKPKLSQTRKKYVPSNRRKPKMSLDDLNKSLGVNN